MNAGERLKHSGLETYYDPQRRFLFRYPSSWHQHSLADERDGVMFSPEPNDPVTWFAVWATGLPDAVQADDLEVLREGVDEGLYNLSGYRNESSLEDTIGDVIRFKRVYTFQENGVTRKRQVWIVYIQKWALALLAQGATPEEYDRWSTVLEGFFGNFNLAPTLWQASNPEGAESPESLVPA